VTSTVTESPVITSTDAPGITASCGIAIFCTVVVFQAASSVDCQVTLDVVTSTGAILNIIGSSSQVYSLTITSPYEYIGTVSAQEITLNVANGGSYEFSATAICPS
jgi:hypothetical protein